MESSVLKPRMASLPVVESCAGGAALLRLQPAHHAGDQRPRDENLRRHHPGPEDRRVVLYAAHHHVAGRGRKAQRAQAVPCMPVETFVQTGERTVMSYLVKPLHDQVMKAFRER